MKVSKRDISIVMVLLGVIALFCVYQFYYRDSQKKVEELQKSINKSTAENNELLKIDETKIENEMKASEESLKKLIKAYPPYYRFDDMIMYLYDLEQVEAYGAHFTLYQLSSAFGNLDNYVDTYIGQLRDKSVAFGCNDSRLNVTFTNETYTGFKGMLKAIYADSYAKNFESIKVRYDNTTGEVRGDMLVHAYGVTDFQTLGQADSNFPGKEVIIPQVKMGVECVFGPTVTPVPTLEVEENGTTTE